MTIDPFPTTLERETPATSAEGAVVREGFKLAAYERQDSVPPARQQVPPAFDALGNPFLTCTWSELSATDELNEKLVMIFDGMPVHEQLYGLYWELFEIASDLIDACREQNSKLPNAYLLLDIHSGKPRGYGFIDTGRPDHFAFIACMHAEYSQSRFAILQPDGIDFEHENATKLALSLGEPA